MSKNSKPTLVIGDLYGQYQIAELARDSDYPVIFLGNYLSDSKQSIRTLQLVLNTVQHRGNRGLLTKHEMSYLNQELRCFNWNPQIQFSIDSFLQCKMKILLKDYIWCEGFLISPAGVSRKLLNNLNIDLNTYLKNKNFDQIGIYQGGKFPCGGIRWCEWNDFEPVDEVNQIVGHTSDDTIRNKGNNWCIDVLKVGEQKGLLIKDGNVEVIDLRDLQHSKYYI